MSSMTVLLLSLVLLGDLATEDHGDLLGLADGPISVQQFLAKLIQCGSPVKDQVVNNIRLGRRRAGADTPLLCARSL